MKLKKIYFQNASFYSLSLSEQFHIYMDVDYIALKQVSEIITAAFREFK
jgi:hypothetical protein